MANTASEVAKRADVHSHTLLSATGSGRNIPTEGCSVTCSTEPREGKNLQPWVKWVYTTIRHDRRQSGGGGRQWRRERNDPGVKMNKSCGRPCVSNKSRDVGM